MSAHELRQAAKVLRALAGLGTIPGPWVCEASGGPEFIVRNPGDVDWTDVAKTEYREEARYIATMHPGVGLALAQWLDNVAHNWQAQSGGLKADATDVARLINGGAA